VNARRSPALPALLVVATVAVIAWVWTSLAALTLPPSAPPAPSPGPPGIASPGVLPEPTQTAGRWSVELEGVAEAAPGARRAAEVDLLPLTGRAATVEVTYDLEAVLAPTSLDALRRRPDWVVGVRLLLGEVGAWRLRDSRWALLEGVGILETVRNRFDPNLANPLRVPGVADWPGCGPGARFADCIDPAQYVGLTTDRALRPRVAVPDPEELTLAADRAVAAWYVFEEALLGEITAGATSFVHLCGGPDGPASPTYGAPLAGCSAAGGDPSRGPAVFRGPSTWSAKQGRYTLETLATVDFEPGLPPTGSRAYPEALRSAAPLPRAPTRGVKP
jgi:hypothetical protein